MRLAINQYTSDGRSTTYYTYLGLYTFISFLFIGLDFLDGQAYVYSVDDKMRELQILDLLSDNNWRDMRQPFLQLPQDYFSPWSRLVDFPYYVAANVLQFFMSPTNATAWSFLIVPPLLLIAFCGATFAIAAKIIGQTPSALSSIAMPFVMVFAILEFTPGRIDHHNFQLLMMSLAFLGVLQQSFRGGLLIGFASSFSIAIGLETLPFIAAIYGGLVFVWILDKPGATKTLISASWSIAAGIILFTWLRHGSSMFIAVECDSISAPWAWVAMSCSSALLICSHYEKYLNSAVKRALSAIVLGSLAIAVVIVAFPQCQSGPYFMIDNVSREFWLDNVWGEHSLPQLAAQGRNFIINMMLPTIIILLLFLPIAWQRIKSDKWGSIIIALGAIIAALITTFISARFYMFAMVLCAPMLPVFLQFTLKDKWLLTNRFGSSIWITTVFVGLVALAVLADSVQAKQPWSPEFFALHNSQCKGEALDVLGEVPPGTIIAPLGLSMTIAQSKYGHKVAALPFHRASAGIRKVALTFTSADKNVRKDAMQPFDYLAVCLNPRLSNREVAPLFVTLMQSESAEGLELVALNAQSNFRLFRITN